MYAVKIENSIHDTDLIIPFDVIKLFNHKTVEIIILQKTDNEKKGKLKTLLDKYKDIKPFSEISDVSDWQRKSRNEW